MENSKGAGEGKMTFFNLVISILTAKEFNI